MLQPSSSSSMTTTVIPGNIILKLRAVSSSPYAQLDQLYIQILSQHPDIKLLRDVFVLIIALDVILSKFICRRLRISEENLRLKLRRMHSLLQISDSKITTYHRSLHDFFQDKKRAGQYHIHPIRVGLVRLPERTRPFAESVWLQLMALAVAFVYAVRFMMAPLFIIPGILCCMYYRCNSLDVIYFFPLPVPIDTDTSRVRQHM